LGLFRVLAQRIDSVTNEYWLIVVNRYGEW
jgi:hypothetical protein